MKNGKHAAVLEMARNTENPETRTEIIDAHEMEQRTGIPATWWYRHTTSRYPAEQRVPHLRFGKYVKFAWGSPALTQWLRDRESR